MADTRLKTAGLPLLLFVISVVFVYMRPVNSPWQPMIAGDGLGYYSYLPATFIYDDRDYGFRWFNAVHDSNYVYSAFPNPEDNFLSKYGDRRINKYYPGLSFLWSPFFAGAHVYALISGHAADGYSRPYQFAIFLASLLNILLGVFFAFRLLNALVRDHVAALLVAAALFFGTYLFIYSIAANSLSHAYSFTLLNAFLFFTHRCLSTGENGLKYLAMALLFLFLSVSVRPLTGLAVLAIPALIPAGFRWRPVRWSPGAALPIAVLMVAVLYNFRIIYIQTGSFLPYTYVGESFDFSNPRFIEALFGYRLGLFVYAPLFFLSLAGLFVTPPRQRWLPITVFMLAVFLYSAWWYWPILVRALIDFYILPAIPVAFLVARWHGRRRSVVVGLLIVCILYFQFKSYQVRNGILVEFGTYKEIFWRNFFRVRPASMYLVPPSTIKHADVFTEDFEERNDASTGISHSGTSAYVLDSLRAIGAFVSYPYPGAFSQIGFQKVRVGFQTFFEGPVTDLHVFIFFRDSSQKLVREVPFYLQGAQLQRGDWDYKEFGMEISPGDSLTGDRVHTISFGAWNVKGQGRTYIDDVRVEFMVTDKSYETIGLPEE